MKDFQVMDIEKIGMTIKEFEVLEDVLSHISDYRHYEDEDYTALKNLKNYFSFHNYKIFRS